MPAIVLVEPSLPENVGAAARAMAGFGLRDLRLVAPACSPTDPRAVAVATHGEHVLAAARVYDTVSAALADRRRVWATTARTKELPLPCVGPRALGAALRAAEARDEAPAVLFGPERTGLRYEHLVHASALVHVPTDPACPALNLAQAVALVSWERWAAGPEGSESSDASWGGGASPPATPPRAEESPPSNGASGGGGGAAGGGAGRGPVPASLSAFDAWFGALTAALDDVGYLSEPTLRVRALRSLRAAFSRAGLTEAELHTLHGVVRALRGRR